MENPERIKTVKKIVLLFFALIFIMMLCSCERQNTESDFSYELYEDGWVISSVTALSRTVHIPESHDGKPVLGIKESAFYRNEIVRKLTIPNTLRFIGKYAFASCSKLNALIFEKGGCCRIDDNAFENCPLLSSVSLNSSVSSIGESAFRNCARLGTLQTDASLEFIGEDAFFACERLILKVQQETAASSYAESHHLATDFQDSVYLQIGLAMIAGILFLVGLLLFEKKLKKRKKALDNSKKLR